MLPRILPLVAVSISPNAAVTVTCQNVEVVSGAVKYQAIALALRTSGMTGALIRLDGVAKVVSVSPLRSTTALLVRRVRPRSIQGLQRELPGKRSCCQKGIPAGGMPAAALDEDQLWQASGLRAFTDRDSY
jgi:hypothetical protein